MTPKLRFYAFLRTGLAQHLQSAGDTLPSAATLEASVDAAGTPIARTLSLRGPGHVVGLDRREILRAEPGAGSSLFEPNYFPFVELATADLPWRYTPEGPSGGRLQPWLVLVVVERRKGVTLTASPDGLNPVLEVDDVSRELPNLGQSKQWAFVQHALDPDDERSLDEQLKEDPERFIARIVCPRDLQPGTSYIAALVPAFNAGQAAGLGASGYDPPTLQPAWGASGSARLPVYYHWSFSTGLEGDFEHLVRRLTPQPLPQTIGYRALDLSAPGSGMTELGGLEVHYQGVLVAPGSSGGWSDSDRRDDFKDELRGEVNRASSIVDDGTDTDTANDPVVGPPIYGGLQAQVWRLDDDAPRWAALANDNPHRRAMAGLGARVVRRNQEALVAGAWDQAGQARTANQLVRQARLASLISTRLADRISRLSDGAFVQMTHGSHNRVRQKAGDTRSGTLRADLRASNLPNGMVSATFQRAARPTTAAARTGRRGERSVPLVTAARVTEQVLSGEIRFQKIQVHTAPAGSVLEGQEAYGGKLTDTRFQVPNLPAGKTESWTYTPSGRPPARSSGRATGGAGHTEFSRSSPPLQRLREARPYISPPDTATTTLAKTARRMREALVPASVIQRRLDSRLSGIASVTLDTPGQPDRVWVQPTFDEPLYEDLLRLGPELFCPGLGGVSDDTVGLLEVNAPSVVAFLLGVNHELLRELVWRGFPCSPTATLCRQFWDSGQPDIGVIEDRGTASIRDRRGLKKLATGVGDQSLALLVRGELLQRYPDLVVYAVGARLNRGKLEPDPTAIHESTFHGVIDGRTQFWGFPFDAKVAKGEDGGDGVFFVIEQQPTGPRFGLDEGTGESGMQAPSNTDDWSWDHAVLSGVHANLLAEPFKGMNSAEVAQATYQRPIRFYAHASTMLT